MNKKSILCGTIALSLALSAGCQKEGTKNTEIGTKSAVVDVVEDSNGSEKMEKNIIEFESDAIDFSKLTYKSSEIEKNEELEKAIVDYLGYNKEEDGEMVYFYNYIDLNGDEKEEIFVYLMGTYVSGTGGSTALIMEKEDYNIISDFTLVQNPVIISAEKTNGWNDIIMPVSGGGIESFYARLKYDGKKYPFNPSLEPELEEGSIIEGVAIISDSISKGDGIILK